MSTDTPPAPETKEFGHPSPHVPYEDAARFIRQILLAKEEGRNDDAATLADFVTSEFPFVGLVEYYDADDINPTFLARWRVGYALPWYYDKGLVEALKDDLQAFDDRDANQEILDQNRLVLRDEFGVANAQSGLWKAVNKKGIRTVAVLRDHAAEPVFRIPADLFDRGPGALETPLHLLSDYRPPWDESDWWAVEEEHLRPRSKTETGKIRKLPDAVQDAIRPWTPPA